MKPRANIYPEATEGRIKTSDTPLPEESRIISKNVEGSKTYEDFKQHARLSKLDKLTNRFVWCAIFLITATSALTFSSALYGRFLPIINVLVKVFAGLLAALIIYYFIRRLIISHASRRYKKQHKKNS